MQQRITSLIEQKRTNVVVSADLTDKGLILALVDKVGPHVLGVKLHSDVIVEWDMKFIHQLQELAKQHNFLIIEDRKFCDIGNTVRLQSEVITQYADLITVHSIPGPGILDGLRENCLKNHCGVLLLAQMSSAGCLIDETYTKRTVDMAEANTDIVVGYICQERLSTTGKLIHFTPGVKLLKGGDAMGQQYNTPQYLVDTKGVDVLIVGRGIYQSEDPIEATKQHVCLPKKK